jgi:acylphosphatase
MERKIGKIMSRARVVVSGRVQGVFFRAFVQERASSLGVTGWVKNRPDGKVECVFEGQARRVSDMVEACRQGPPRADVEDVMVTFEDYKGEFAAFSVARWR